MSKTHNDFLNIFTNYAFYSSHHTSYITLYMKDALVSEFFVVIKISRAGAKG